ncbi:MAG: aromatic ring-hydroxylating oxygenase subunit alpha, partial [Acidimicrobiales bacterium]
MSDLRVPSVGVRSAAEVDPDEVDRILSEGATLPGVFYTDQRIAQLEDELIFRPSWQIVGVEPELRKGGDYFTTEIGGYGFTVPIVVLRDHEMRLRAYINVCRHRAHFVAVGCGGGRRFLQCSYHGWTYGLDGGLRSVPRASEGGLPPFEQLGLHPLSVDTWKGYIFVTLKEVESLAVTVGGLERVMVQEGFDFPFAPDNADPDFENVRDVQARGGPA